MTFIIQIPFLPIHFDSEGGEGVAVVKLLVFVNDFFLLTENVIAHYIKKIGNYFFLKKRYISTLACA